MLRKHLFCMIKFANRHFFLVMWYSKICYYKMLIIQSKVFLWKKIKKC
jgi:hypothetical protein